MNYLAGIHEIAVRSEYTDGRDMPRLLIRSVEFEGPYHETWPPQSHRNIFVDFDRKNDTQAWARKIVHDFATRAYRRPVTAAEESALMAVYREGAGKRTQLPGAVKDTLLVVLTSPQFLFLVETSATPGAGAAGQLRTGLEAFLFPVERTAGSQDAAAGLKRITGETTGSRSGANDRGSALLPIRKRICIPVAEPG